MDSSLGSVEVDSAVCCQSFKVPSDLMGSKLTWTVRLFLDFGGSDLG